MPWYECWYVAVAQTTNMRGDTLELSFRQAQALRAGMTYLRPRDHPSIRLYGHTNLCRLPFVTLLATMHTAQTLNKTLSSCVHDMWTEPRNPVKGVRGALCIMASVGARRSPSCAFLSVFLIGGKAQEHHGSVCYSSYLINHKSIIPTSSRMTFNCNMKFVERRPVLLGPLIFGPHASPEDLELGIKWYESIPITPFLLGIQV